MEWTAVIVAFIAATPPTIAAILSNKKLTKVQHQVTPSNGVKTATIIESIKDQVDSLSRRLNHHSDIMNQHITDSRAHRAEAARAVEIAQHIQEDINVIAHAPTELRPDGESGTGLGD